MVDGLAPLRNYNGLFYVGSPYTLHEGGLAMAYRDACKVTAKLISERIHVISPIAHSHGIALHGGLDPTDHGIWMPADEPLMKVCFGLIIAMLPGWENSRGVVEEMRYFHHAKKPIFMLDPATMTAWRVMNIPETARSIPQSDIGHYLGLDR